MSETLYVQTEKNVEIHSPDVYLKDVAKLTCSNKQVLARNQVRKVFSVPDDAPGRYVLSAMEMIAVIEREEANVDVTHIGEANIIVTYENQKHQHVCWSWVKTTFVCLVTFFGGAFSIMTFNTDVDTSGLFAQIYRQMTGNISNGKTVLEASYSIGIGLGVIYFFNHFGRHRLTEDPTPMEVQMRVYEDEVNKTLVEQRHRGQKEKK